MIHKITSFLLLKEIVNFQMTCKLFQKVCKLNTYEPLDYYYGGNDLKYSKYLQYYKSLNDENEQNFRLRHIKVLDMDIYNETQLNHNINLIKKYHKNITKFNCEIYLSEEYNYKSFEIFESVMVNKLSVLGPGGFTHYDQLLKYTKNLELFEIKLTNKMLQSLAKSQISELDIGCCTYDVTIDDINLREWKSLKYCHMETINHKVINCFASQPPNLINFALDLVDDVSTPIQFGKSIKILSIQLKFANALKNFNYFFDMTGCKFNHVRLSLYAVEIMDFDMINLIEVLMEFGNQQVNDYLVVEDLKTEQAKMIKQKFEEKISIESSWRGFDEIVDIFLTKN